MGVLLKSSDMEGKNANRGNVTEEVECSDVSKPQQIIRRDIEEIFGYFMAMSDDMSLDAATSSLSDSCESQSSIGIDFGTDIESDGAGPSTLGEEDIDDSSKDAAESRSIESDTKSASNHTDKKEEFIKQAKLLSKIGDDINDKYIKGNTKVEHSLQNVTGQMLTAGVGHIFEESLDLVLDDFSKSTYQEDRHRVALIMLCTRQVVRTMKKTVDYTETTSSQVINSAIDYITTHYPDWLSTR